MLGPVLEEVGLVSLLAAVAAAAAASAFVAAAAAPPAGSAYASNAATYVLCSTAAKSRGGDYIAANKYSLPGMTETPGNRAHSMTEKPCDQMHAWSNDVLVLPGTT